MGTEFDGACAVADLVEARATLKTKEEAAGMSVEVVSRLEKCLSKANSGVEELRNVREELWAA